MGMRSYVVKFLISHINSNDIGLFITPLLYADAIPYATHLVETNDKKNENHSTVAPST